MLVCLFSWKLNETYGKREGGEIEERGRVGTRFGDCGNLDG